jgi:hypothetical protein
VKPYINVTQFKWGLLKILFWLLLRDMCHYMLWKALNEVKSVTYLWSSSISFSQTTCLWTPSCYVIIKYQNLCYSYHWLLCNMTTTFDFWMSKLSYDMFVLVINFIDQSWFPYHIIFEPFEAPNTYSITLVKQVKL